jgi:hypothetical protein
MAARTDAHPCEIAWAAGIIEGEGCLTRRKSKPGCASLSVGMTDEDVVRRLHAVFGAGSVRGPLSRGSGKPFWVWHVAKRAHLLAILPVVYPYMGLRRRARIEEVLGAFREIPFRHRQLVDRAEMSARGRKGAEARWAGRAAEPLPNQMELGGAS